MGRYIIFLLLASLLVLIDLYVYQGVKVLTLHLRPFTRTVIYWIYWGITSILVVSVFVVGSGRLNFQNIFFRRFLLPLFFINLTTKLFAAFFLLLDDVFRGIRWAFHQATPTSVSNPSTNTGITRSTFLVKTAMAATAVPVLTMSYGILSGAHDYRVHRIKVKLPHLPSAFHGIRIGQLSDIHSGSFFNQAAVKRGVDMLLREKTDLIFFTGDLVNNTADELAPYFNIFDKVTAPLGVYSVLGNHDYGDYIRWPSRAAKNKNLQNLYAAHQQLGWQLLINEHKMITQGSDRLAVIGVENWGTGGFPKYGRLEQAYRGAESAPVKLLLSHDPSHWDAQIRPSYTDIDITFSGHTHGGQVGIELPLFRWSPVQYRYKQWAGLYRAGTQYLYVNRGYGYIGYPGRIGILPEITVIELEKAS
ncbi:MAG: metallophosphoesterase [Bacteroidota bacterium]